ncbi:hypothetical protein Tco_0616899, partial [Tanacetum coccineum]
MWCCEHHAEITAMVNDTTHVLIWSSSSRPSHSPRSAQNLGMAECSN